jgi:hypothetical protein
MKRGYVTGRKVEKRNTKEQARLEQMGAAIAQTFAGKTPEELLRMALGKPR